MSLKIQEQPGAVCAAGPVAPITLSERVEGRRPQGQPSSQQVPQPEPQQTQQPTLPPEPQQTAADAPLPDTHEPEMPPWPEQTDVIVPREQLDIHGPPRGNQSV